jgi:hypothetical protein
VQPLEDRQSWANYARGMGLAEGGRGEGEEQLPPSMGFYSALFLDFV